nr:hypothetical protein [Nocardioidaceae bacterium]
VQRRGRVLTGPHGQVVVTYRGANTIFERGDDLARHGVAAGDGSVLAPMPGTVLAVNVQVGEQVLEGDPLAVMEAMKMELALKAPWTGVVTEVNVDTGARVELGATLFKVAPSEESSDLASHSTFPQQPR